MHGVSMQQVHRSNERQLAEREEKLTELNTVVSELRQSLTVVTSERDALKGRLSAEVGSLQVRAHRNNLVPYCHCSGNH